MPIILMVMYLWFK